MHHVAVEEASLAEAPGMGRLPGQRGVTETWDGGETWRKQRGFHIRLAPQEALEVAVAWRALSAVSLSKLGPVGNC